MHNEGQGRMFSSRNEMSEEYILNQRRGYGFRVPEMMSELSKVNVQRVIGLLQFNSANSKIFNLDAIAKKSCWDKNEVEKRLRKMTEQRLILSVIDSPMEAYDFFLAYLAIKLKSGVSREEKAELSKNLLENDYLCTGYETEGDYDFYVGGHVQTIDRFNEKIMKKLFLTPAVEEIKILPVQRTIRQERKNHWDAPRDRWRMAVYAPNEFSKLEKIQDKLDKTDLKIIESLNERKDPTDHFDITFFPGEKETTESILHRIFEKRIILSPVFLNWMKLNYRPHFFLVKLDEGTSAEERMKITNEIAETPAFNLVFQHNDSYFDITLCAYQNLVDLDSLKGELEKIEEVQEIAEMEAVRQYRIWSLRLDEENWGECIMRWE